MFGAGDLARYCGYPCPVVLTHYLFLLVLTLDLWSLIPLFLGFIHSSEKNSEQPLTIFKISPTLKTIRSYKHIFSQLYVFNLLGLKLWLHVPI
jgi:hypothetical protein